MVSSLPSCSRYRLRFVHRTGSFLLRVPRASSPSKIPGPCLFYNQQQGWWGCGVRLGWVGIDPFPAWHGIPYPGSNPHRSPSLGHRIVSPSLSDPDQMGFVPRSSTDRKGTVPQSTDGVRPRGERRRTGWKPRSIEISRVFSRYLPKDIDAAPGEALYERRGRWAVHVSEVVGRRWKGKKERDLNASLEEVAERTDGKVLVQRRWTWCSTSGKVGAIGHVACWPKLERIHRC